MKWYIYILRCADDTLYTGITNNIEARMAAHNAGTASKYTRARRPVSLAYTKPTANRSTASKREAELKKLTRTKKENLISKSRAKSAMLRAKVTNKKVSR